ncbi:hypothetical protein GGS26DRAFT_199307 [Hypomontagnella submonticulosa]|nr:hypothetical protein GGS26DRAFT_199307 [Hypomontagnella submonticulosa]
MPTFWETFLLVVSAATTLPSVASCIHRFATEPRTNLCHSVWAEVTTGLAMICGLVGILCAAASIDGLQNSSVFDGVDAASLTCLYLGSMLGKVSIYSSLRPIISKSKAWKLVIAIQIALILLANPFYSLIAYASCDEAKEFPLLGFMPGECFSENILHTLDFVQIFLEIFIPLSMFIITFVMAWNVPPHVRSTFFSLSTTAIIIVINVAARITDIVWIRSGDIPAPWTAIEVFAIMEMNSCVLAANLIPIISQHPRRIDPILRAFNHNVDPPSGDDAPWIPLADLRGVSATEDEASV